MIPTFLTTQTIPSAWFELVYGLIRGNATHHSYTIDKGSYVGAKRLEYDYVTVVIQHPGTRPLIPDIPPGLGIPAPVESMDYVDNYFARYLMDPELEANETYKYSTWLAPGVERVIEQLKGAPGNNQATISIGGLAMQRQVQQCAPVKGSGLYLPGGTGYPSLPKFLDTDNEIDPGTGQRDPACLRVVDFRLDQENKLHMVVYFRSWDLWGGFPANLAGLQLLKEYVGQQLGADDGVIIASSKGLHIYDYAIDVAAKRCNLANVGTLDDLAAWWGKER